MVSKKIAKSVKQIADCFTRFLIGSKESAIFQLNALKDSTIGPRELGGAKYNDQWTELVEALGEAIKDKPWIEVFFHAVSYR